MWAGIYGKNTFITFERSAEMINIKICAKNNVIWWNSKNKQPGSRATPLVPGAKDATDSTTGGKGVSRIMLDSVLPGSQKTRRAKEREGGEGGGTAKGNAIEGTQMASEFSDWNEGMKCPTEMNI